MAIPPCDLKTRHIGAHVKTTDMLEGYIRAEYTSKTIYKDPNEAPVFAVMFAEAKGRWRAEVKLQAFAKDEQSALCSLRDVLTEVGIAVPPELLAVITSWFTGWESLPWTERPMGLRSFKPRRERTLWVDKDGKKVHIYKDTMRAHADPDCTCERCAAHRPPPKDTK
jgi:hypothetical protein